MPVFILLSVDARGRSVLSNSTAPLVYEHESGYPWLAWAAGRYGHPYDPASDRVPCRNARADWELGSRLRMSIARAVAVRGRPLLLGSDAAYYLLTPWNQAARIAPIKYM